MKLILNGEKIKISVRMDIQFMKENFKMENSGEKDCLLFKMV